MAAYSPRHMTKHDESASHDEAATAEGQAVAGESTSSPASERPPERARPWWEPLAAVTKAIIGAFGL